MRRKEGIVLFRKLLWRYELVSVLVMCSGRSNGCYGLSRYLSFPFLFDRVDLLVVVLLIRYCSRRASGSLLLFVGRF